ncbi:MAG TPA: hypothetical protein VNH84_00265, partial [Candidatus Saccharimonadales bacterium]|nr:hypothetical protein [Candidatus Saccharimonadales bacterium]
TAKHDNRSRRATRQFSAVQDLSPWRRTWIFLSPCFCLSGSLVAMGSFAENVRANPRQLRWRPLDENHGVKKMGTKR